MKIFKLLPILFLVSCISKTTHEGPQDTQVKPNELQLWNAKAQIKELKKDKTQQVSLDFVVMPPGSIRVDVSGPMGISLAALVVQDDHIRYAIYRQKAFYEGLANEKALRSVLRMDLNARYLLNISLDQPILDKGWQCLVDSQGVLQNCSNKDRGLKIVWLDRDGFKKRVLLTNADYEVQILFKEHSTKVLSPEAKSAGPFHLEIPEGFQRYKIL